MSQVTKPVRPVKPSAQFIVATFAPNGPEQRSGLAGALYAPAELHGEFGPAFELLERAIVDQAAL